MDNKDKFLDDMQKDAEQNMTGSENNGDENRTGIADDANNSGAPEEKPADIAGENNDTVSDDAENGDTDDSDAENDIAENVDVDNNDEENSDIENEDNDASEEEISTEKPSKSKKKIQKMMGEKDKGKNKGKKLAKEKRKKPVVDKRNKTLKMISVSTAILFIAIVMVFNFLLESFLGDKFKWDWSQTNMFSIGDVTEKLLSELTDDVKIYALYEKGKLNVPEISSIEVLLEKYEEKSKGKVVVEYIDPVKNPSIIKDIDPDELEKIEAGNFVVSCENTGKIKVLGVYDLLQIGYDQSYNQVVEGVTAEESFSGAILFVTSEKTPVVYMSKGHGEADYNESYTVLLNLIKNNNFLVKELDMLSGAEIPEDASLIFMLNPQMDINTAEKRSLENYLKNGASLLVMTEFNRYSFPVLNSLLNSYNIEITDNRVREGNPDRRFSGNQYVFLSDVNAGIVSEKTYESLALMVNPRALKEVKNVKEWIKVESLFVTGNESYQEPGGVPEDAGEPGEVTLAIASENTGFIDGENIKESAKIMVYGSTEFLSDSVLNMFGAQLYNMYAFYESINWLVEGGQESLMIAPKKLPSYNLESGSGTARWVAAIVVVIVIPLALIITAISVYIKRRNL